MWNKRPFRPLLLALLLSMLAHVAMFGQLPAWLFPDQDEPGMPITVELAQMPALAPPVAENPEVPPEKPAAAAPSPQPPPHPTEPISPIQPEAPPIPAAAMPPAPEKAIPDPPPMTEASPPSPAETAVIAEEPAPPPLPEDEPAAAPPHRVEVEYQIWRKGSVGGTERHSYKAGEDGSYSLSSIAEPKGLLSLVLSKLVQKSEGTVTERGLQPATFLYQYGSNPDRTQKATFDRQSGKLVMETGKRRQVADLPEGAQDLMSFMYQFMFTPPLQEMQITITNGKRLKTYDYGFEGEETVDMAMGGLRCLHISHSGSAGEEKTELWLAADYHYVPVKIRKTEKDGTVLERIATRLQME